MKYLKKIIPLILLVLFILWISILYIVKKNDKYEEKLIEEIKNNYKTNEEITEVNKYDNNYIVITTTKVIVLNSKYKNIKEEQTTKLAKNINNYKLIYKNNKLIYENTILKKDKIEYKFYDAYTYKYLDSITLEE